MDTRRARGAALEINFWPSYTDIGMLMILILILFLFIQIASNSQAFKLQKIKTKQDQLEKMLRQAIETEGMAGVVTITPDLNFQKITFSDKILFASGSADLKGDGQRILTTMGNVLRNNASVYASIRIEGHTDNVPLEGSGKFRTNWDLSSGRATEVVEFLNRLGVDPKGGKLYAAGYSEFNPRARNDTEADKALNRRIEMIINYSADEPEN